MEKGKKYQTRKLDEEHKVLEEPGAAYSYGVSVTDAAPIKNSPLDKSYPNPVTLEAIRQAEEGESVVCESFEDYLKKTGQCATN